MKIKTLLKLMFATIISAAAITSVALFSNVNTIKLPSVKVLTKQNYNDILKTQKVDKGPSIDYYSLANSSYNVLDIAKANTISSNYYFFFFGSDAYTSTTKALYGWEQAVPQSTYLDPVKFENSIMLNLYDLFFNEANKTKLSDYGIQNINPTFYSYVDVSFNQSTIEGERLLNYRAYAFPGSYYPNGSRTPVIGSSNQWRIGTDIANIRYENVVSTTNYSYEPKVDSYYEFRPNDGEDTKYEKVYFRNQDYVKNYNITSQFMKNYGSAKGFTFNDTGTLLAVKEEGSTVSYLAFNDFSLSINKILIDIIKFFNPDSTISDNEEVVGDGSTGDGSTGESTTPETFSDSHFEHEYITTPYSYTLITENSKDIIDFLYQDAIVVKND